MRSRTLFSSAVPRTFDFRPHLTPPGFLAVPRRASAVARFRAPRHLLGGFVVLVSAGCWDDRSTAGPWVDDPLPADVEVGEDAPVDLSYVCGNRFLVSNAHR